MTEIDQDALRAALIEMTVAFAEGVEWSDEQRSAYEMARTVLSSLQQEGAAGVAEPVAWVTWPGGAWCPIEPSIGMVQLKLRNGDVRVEKAKFWRWYKNGDHDDIVAFRIAVTVPDPAPAPDAGKMSVPEGWQLVPKELTKAQAVAFWNAKSSPVAKYTALLAAAPPSSTPDPDAAWREAVLKEREACALIARQLLAGYDYDDDGFGVEATIRARPLP